MNKNEIFKTLKALEFTDRADKFNFSAIMFEPVKPVFSEGEPPTFNCRWFTYDGVNRGVADFKEFSFKQMIDLAVGFKQRLMGLLICDPFIYKELDVLNFTWDLSEAKTELLEQISNENRNRK